MGGASVAADEAAVLRLERRLQVHYMLMFIIEIIL